MATAKKRNEWADFAEEVDSLSVRHRRRTCGVLRLLDSLDPDGREQVSAALKRPDVTSTGLEEALRKRLTDKSSVPSSFTLQRHRNGRCCCDNEEGGN